MKRISILGSTGSIGTQALAVARWQEYKVVGLAAGKNIDLLLKQVAEFSPQFVSCNLEVVDKLKPQLPSNVKLVSCTEIAQVPVDIVVAAISGIAGLKSTRAAIKAGQKVALANKEAMVVAGPLMQELACKHSSTILPVDSEHSALFQCLLGEAKEQVDKLVLTASGGPFHLEPKDLSSVTPQQALKHPNWSMGKKVTIDSATLFNKGLEVLEAHFLFEFPLEDIEVVIHPQSLVHGLVRFKDGNIKAQIGPHDMRLPIQYALESPNRPLVPFEPLSLKGIWEFYEPDLKRFPSLGLAYEAGRQGGTAPVALNAADEIAVEAFLQGKIGFTNILGVLDYALEQTPHHSLSWQAIYEIDNEARKIAQDHLKNCTSK